MNENSRIGYVYSISGYGLTYVGSTIQPICERKSTHKLQYKYWIDRNREGWKCASYDILDKGNEWEMKILETILTDTNKIELLEREQYYINNLNAINGLNYIVNTNNAILTEEQRKEYQRKWAENKRREKGIPIKEKIKTADEKEYKKLKQREYRAKMTEEEKKAHLEHRKELYAKKEQTEEQKEAAKERARKQRKAIKSDPEKVEKDREYKRLKAKEYYAKKKEQEQKNNEKKSNQILKN